MTDAPSNIVAALARVHVDDLDAALPLYRELTGDEPHTFGFRDIRLATVGAFLLIEGGDEQVRSRTATVIVRDIAWWSAPSPTSEALSSRAPHPHPTVHD